MATAELGFPLGHGRAPGPTPANPRAERQQEAEPPGSELWEFLSQALSQADTMETLGTNPDARLNTDGSS